MAEKKIDVKLGGKTTTPVQSGLNFSGNGPLIPEGAVMNNTVVVKTNYKGGKFVGSADDVLKQMQQNQLQPE